MLSEMAGPEVCKAVYIEITAITVISICTVIALWNHQKNTFCLKGCLNWDCMPFLLIYVNIHIYLKNNHSYNNSFIYLSIYNMFKTFWIYSIYYWDINRKQKYIASTFDINYILYRYVIYIRILLCMLKHLLKAPREHILVWVVSAFFQSLVAISWLVLEILINCTFYNCILEWLSIWRMLTTKM